MTLALITGSSQGIGRATALHLGSRGVDLLLLGRPSAEQTRSEALLTEQKARFSVFDCDFSERDSVDAALALALKTGATPDVILHNAGTIERSSLDQMSDEVWDRQIEVNLNSPFRITRAFLPAMKARGSGRILFVSSISAVLGTKDQSAYHASKAGLLGMMRCLASELSDTGLFTLALLPGSVDTRLLKGSPFPPRMSPEDLASTLGFYALDASAAHNGAAIEMFGI